MLKQVKAAEQSVQPTGGTRRGFQAFFWLQVFSALGVLSRPAHQRLTHTVSPLPANRKEIPYGITKI